MDYTTGNSDINCKIQCKLKENWCENIFSMFAHEVYRHESKKPKQIKRYMLQRTEISYYSKYFAQAEDSA